MKRRARQRSSLALPTTNSRSEMTMLLIRPFHSFLSNILTAPPPASSSRSAAMVGRHTYRISRSSFSRLHSCTRVLACKLNPMNDMQFFDSVRGTVLAWPGLGGGSCSRISLPPSDDRISAASAGCDSPKVSRAQPITDPKAASAALYCLSRSSRAAVDETIEIGRAHV